MTKKGEASNKFLPAFDKEKAKKLKAILEELRGSGLSFEGFVRSLDDILERPSSVRKCDVVLMRGLFEAITKM